MWRKVDDRASNPATSCSNQDQNRISEMLMNAIHDSSHASEPLVDGPEPKLIQNEQDSYPPIFQEYAKASEKFSKSAKEFIRCAALLSEARQAYETLITASERIRTSLDSDERQFRALMDLAQDQAKVHLASTESPSGRKPAESSTLEPFLVNSGAKLAKFP
jgi:hypothetical protein